MAKTKYGIPVDTDESDEEALQPDKKKTSKKSKETKIVEKPIHIGNPEQDESQAPSRCTRLLQYSAIFLVTFLAVTYFNDVFFQAPHHGLQAAALAAAPAAAPAKSEAPAVKPAAHAAAKPAAHATARAAASAAAAPAASRAMSEAEHVTEAKPEGTPPPLLTAKSAVGPPSVVVAEAAGAASAAPGAQAAAHKAPHRIFRIAAAGVYDEGWPRPRGMSPQQAANAALWLSQQGSAAWENPVTPRRKFDNPGNLVWSLGARRLLGGRVLDFQRNRWPGTVFDLLYIATGPMFGDRSSPGRVSMMMSLVHNVPKPLAIVGMGIDPVSSGNVFACPNIRMTQQSRGMLDLIQERITQLGGFVGVRGKCSEEKLRKAGYTVFEALGCPSLFINMQPGLGARIESKWKTLPARSRDPSFKVGIVMPERYNRAVVHFLVRFWVQYPGTVHIVQGVEYFARACKELGVPVPKRTKATYYDAVHWQQDLRGFDLVVAARIHGSMIAVAAETPVVTIPMDMRIKEMCDMMHLLYVLPSNPLLDLKHNTIEESLTGLAQRFDGAAFDTQRSVLAARYKELFGKVGVKLDWSL